jgi:hypothetical protein
VAFKARETNEYSYPRYLEFWDRQIEDLRKARMPEDADSDEAARL